MDKLNPSQLSEYSEAVRRSLIDNKSWRAGQAMFNVLYDTYPGIANRVRSTPIDPFYNNKKIWDFLLDICDDEAIQNINPFFRRLVS